MYCYIGYIFICVYFRIMSYDYKNGVPVMSDLVSIYNIGYDREYQNFDYDKYINVIKMSNFTGGGTLKKNPVSNQINLTIKNMYISYIFGNPSVIKLSKKINKKKKGGEGKDFYVEIKDMKNIANLEYDKDYVGHFPKNESKTWLSNFEIM